MFFFDSNIPVRGIQNRFLVGVLPDGVGPKKSQVFVLLVRVRKPVIFLVQLHLEVPQLEIGFGSRGREYWNKKKHSYINFGHHGR